MEHFLVECTVPKKAKDDRLYDCIWRAHRDVMLGRRSKYIFNKYVEKYQDVINALYNLISNTHSDLCSKMLFDELSDFDIEFGAMQKIVNMTLKYIVILNAYGQLNIPVKEEECDCPIDSIILGNKKVNRSDLKWTSSDFDKNKYNEVKEIISKDEVGKVSGLRFDFVNWKK